MFEYQWYSDTINSHEDSGTGVTMLEAAGISGRGRAELAQVLGLGRRFITPTDVVNTLDVDADTAAKKLARWAEDGWVRRVRRGLYIGVPVEAINPAAWSEDRCSWPPRSGHPATSRGGLRRTTGRSLSKCSGPPCLRQPSG